MKQDLYSPLDQSFSDETLPGRLQDFSISDLSDPNAVIEIIEMLQEEIQTHGKRNQKVVRNATEGLEYIYDVFPEFREKEYSKTPLELHEGYGKEKFSSDNIDERIDWLEAVYDVWSSKQRRNDSMVEIVRSPHGEGYALEHGNKELGYVKEDPGGQDNSTSGTAVFRTKETAKEVIKEKHLIDITLSDEDKKDETKIVEQFKYKRQLTIFDAIDFVNKIDPDPFLQQREGFSSKSLEILDNEKKWPKLSKTPMSGWVAMETAVRQGFNSKATESPKKYSIIQKRSNKAIRLKKAEYDLFNHLGNTIGNQVIEKELIAPLTKNQLPTQDLSKEDIKVQEEKLLRDIGRKAIPELKLTDKDAFDVGRTIKMVDDGLLTKNDWKFFCDRLHDQYATISLAEEKKKSIILFDSKRENFTSKSLKILDKKKKWPKLSKTPMSGWVAMETACRQGFNSKITESPRIYSIENETSKKSIRLKKAEYDYFNQISAITTDKDIEDPNEKQQKLIKIKEKLTTPWSTPEKEVLKYTILKHNSRSESQKKVLTEVINDLENKVNEASKQMKTNGFLDDNLGQDFHSLPSKFSFERNLSQTSTPRLAKSPKGSVYEIEKVFRENKEDTTFNINIHSLNGTKETLSVSNDKESWDFHRAMKEAIAHAGYFNQKELNLNSIEEKKEPTTPNPTISIDNSTEIHRLNFKKFLSEIHNIHYAKPQIKSETQKQEIQKLLQEWGNAIVVAATNGLPIPKENITAFKGAIDKNLIEFKDILPPILSNEKNDTPFNNEADKPTLTEPKSESLGTEQSKKAYELTKEEFVATIGSINNPKPEMTAYIFTHYPEKHRAEIDNSIKNGKFSSVEEFIHEKIVSDAINLRLDVPGEVLKDYPNITKPLQEIWKISNKEFLDNAKKYQEHTDYDDEKYMQQVMTGSLHKREVAKAIKNGANVPENVMQEYPELQIEDNNLKM